jgi:acetyltransferase-like isoleucine patch superfamily enzyme
MNNAYVSPRVKLGKGTMVKSNALIGHDVKCGPLCHFAMGSITGAFTQLGVCADVATGCVVLEKISIGNYSFAGAASLISHDIPDYEIHVGSPAKFLKKIRLD